MGQSLVKNYLHIVFSTKLRVPIIHPPYNLELYSYLGGICNNLESQVLKVGGYSDHVHILCMLSKKIALMKLLEELKSHSSKWMKTKDMSNMMNDTFGISYFALSGLKRFSFIGYTGLHPCVNRFGPFRANNFSE